jgi:hypothetical protein
MRIGLEPFGPFEIKFIILTVLEPKHRNFKGKHKFENTVFKILISGAICPTKGLSSNYK